MGNLADPRRLIARMLVGMINARELERTRISRVLHDEVGQNLSAVGLQLDVLRMDFEKRLPDIVARTAEIQRVLEEAIKRVRELSYELHPAVVEKAGIHMALDRLVGRFREAFPGSIRFLFDSTIRLPRDQSNALYKIAEQALENAVQHARANRIEVLMKSGGRNCTLEVRDDGTGFSPAESRQNSFGLGFLLMEHCAAEAGLTLAIKSSPGKGTIIRATCPTAWESGGVAGPLQGLGGGAGE